MQYIKKKQTIKPYYILGFLLIFFPFLFEEKEYKSIMYVNYFIQLCYLVYSIRESNNQIRALLSPSFLCSFYLLVSFVLGSLLFRNDLHIDSSHMSHYIQWTHSRLCAMYYNSCFYITSILFFYSQPFGKIKSLPSYRIYFNIPNVIILVSLVLVGLIWGKTFDASGPTINYPITIATLSALFLFYLCKDKPVLIRFLFYIGIIALFAIFRFSNKREAIFLFVPILLLESRYLNKKSLVTIKNIILGTLGSIVVLFLVTLMSFQRVDHHNDMNSVINVGEVATGMVEAYTSSDHLWPLLADNFEIDYVFINSHQSLEFIIKEPSLMALGSTYLKPFLAPIPRFIMPDKPEAAITLYSQRYDKAAADAGLSLPLSMQAEGFWNFGYLGGLICVTIIFYLLNRFYLTIYDSVLRDEGLRTVFYIYLFFTVFLLYRDCGFTKLLIGFISAYFLCLLLSLIFKKI